jgi:hypothetical protein
MTLIVPVDHDRLARGDTTGTRPRSSRTGPMPMPMRPGRSFAGSWSFAPLPALSEITPLVAKLALPFVTVDVVRRTDGVWRVVELGDGQVSDRPAAVSPEALVEMLFSRQGLKR